jgi:hypothetical protein
MALPKKLHINAYTGTFDPGSDLHQDVKRWAAKDIVALIQLLKPGAQPDLTDWRDPRVGWGLVLPENTELNLDQRATAIDAPKPIQDLVEYRGNAPVLRYDPDIGGHLRRYYGRGKVNDPNLIQAPRGTSDGAIPRYLLIYASPKRIPWSFQYALNGVAFTGRLYLDDEDEKPGQCRTEKQLANYVNALKTDWAGSVVNIRQPVIWAAYHGAADITSLMRSRIACKVHEQLAQDDEVTGAHFLDGKRSPATHDALLAALDEAKPAFVLTTSHGRTGPLGPAHITEMRTRLGLLVDNNNTDLSPTRLLQSWSPSGAIWYAHACCSAGADSRTAYDGLVKTGSYADQVLKGVTAAGSIVAPLPRRLLGAEHPLRAFIGHVEPTFDWTLRDPQTRQTLTNALVEALYNRLHLNEPVGYAFERCFQQGGQLRMVHDQILQKFNAGNDQLQTALAARLVAQDLESLVILGDPAVCLPPW